MNDDETHIVLIYDADEDSVAIDFQGSSIALAREIVRMANEVMSAGTWRCENESA